MTAPVRAWALVDGFGFDHLKLIERPREELPPGYARLAVEAVSLNRRDVLLIEGSYAPRLKFPAIPCCDAAGRVIEVGAGCQRLKLGDTVVAHMFPKWRSGRPTTEALRSGLGGVGAQGTLCSEIVLPEEVLLPVPPHLDMRAAATLPCAALTAWSAVVKFGEAAPGTRVLVQGTGGVSLFALQFAKERGAFVVATSSKPEKLARLKTLGADAVFNYTEPGWSDAARKLTGEGFDLIVEVAGGDLDATLRLISPGGMVAVIGVLSSARGQMTLPLVLMRQVAMQGVTCGSLADFTDMLSDIASSQLQPIVSDVYPFAEAPRAFQAMQANALFGKIVVDMVGAR